MSFSPFEIALDILHQTCVVINLSQLQRKLLITSEASFITLNINAWVANRFTLAQIPFLSIVAGCYKPTVSGLKLH